MFENDDQIIRELKHIDDTLRNLGRVNQQIERHIVNLIKIQTKQLEVLESISQGILSLNE